MMTRTAWIAAAVFASVLACAAPAVADQPWDECADCTRVCEIIYSQQWEVCDHTYYLCNWQFCVTDPYPGCEQDCSDRHDACMDEIQTDYFNCYNACFPYPCCGYPFVCEDDLFCTGRDWCTPDPAECYHAGSPCAVDELCDEDADRCVATDSCDGCKVQCGIDYDEDADDCDADWRQCQAGCDADPWPGCSDECESMKIGCYDEALRDRQDCEARCDWFPCCTDNPCDDGLYCNGVETCSEEMGQCTPGEAVECADDGLFCNGDEVCDDSIDDCASTGDPCDGDETCDEDQDLCEPTGDDDDDDSSPPCGSPDGYFWLNR